MSQPTALSRLLGVIDALLGPDGCPWDKEQTPQSLADYIVEETFELVDAIRSDDAEGTMEELGDVLFLLLFVARRHADAGDFSLDDALNQSADKMIRRHPHVFGELEVVNRETLLDNWERIKRGEKEKTGKKRVFDSLPAGLPPLLKAYRINSKAARQGFTWPDDDAVEAQAASEWAEFKEALASGSAEQREEEFGDYLFTLAELGRRKGIKANAALDFANRKFLARFAAMEDLAEERGLVLADLNLEEMDGLWNEVKAAG